MVKMKLEAEWTGHALELPYDFDALEASVNEAIWRFLQPDLFARETRDIKVRIVDFALPDAPGRVMGMRIVDGAVEVYNEPAPSRE